MLSAAWGAAAALCLLGTGSASAQQTGLNARAQSAHAGWRQLSQGEVDCVDQMLRARRTNLWTEIQRGAGPDDPAMAKLRAACRTPTRAANAPKPNPTQALAAADTRSAERRADERLAAELAAEIAAAKKAAAEKAAAEKIAAEKAAAEKIAAEKAAARKASEDKAAAEKLAAERAAAEKAEKDKAAADKRAAEQAAKAAADKAAEDEAARKTQANKLAAEQATSDVGHPGGDAVQPQNPASQVKAAHDEHPRPDKVRPVGEDAYAQWVSESRLNFVYGLLIGPIIFCFGGVVFLLIGGYRSRSSA
jgi:hypothetical protein